MSYHRIVAVKFIRLALSALLELHRKDRTLKDAKAETLLLTCLDLLEKGN